MLNMDSFCELKLIFIFQLDFLYVMLKGKEEKLMEKNIAKLHHSHTSEIILFVKFVYTASFTLRWIT